MSGGDWRDCGTGGEPGGGAAPGAGTGPEPGAALASVGAAPPGLGGDPGGAAPGPPAPGPPAPWGCCPASSAASCRLGSGWPDNAHNRFAIPAIASPLRSALDRAQGVQEALVHGSPASLRLSEERLID